MEAQNTGTMQNNDRVLSYQEIAGMFFTCMEDTWFPFSEDENANITGLGHQDKEIFALNVNKYDELSGGYIVDEEDKWTASDVKHGWAAIKYAPDDENALTIDMVDEGEENAIPLTMMWNMR